MVGRRTTEWSPVCCVSAGDDVTNDYLGPRQLGWQSLLVDRWGGGYDTVPSEEVITNLEDVLKLL